jgi:hypothetical protein
VTVCAGARINPLLGASEAAMTATFAPGDASTITGLGFDAMATPPWLSVPFPGGTKTVLLTGGDGLSLSVANTGTVTFQELPRTAAGRPIVITAIRPGTVRLSAGQATLEITVKAPKKLATFIHFVFDKSGRSSNKGLTEAVQAMEVTNKLFVPQANVLLFRRDSGGFHLPFDLPWGVPVGDASVESNLLSHMDPQSDYNIFFVQQVSEPNSRAVTVAYTPVDSRGRVRNCCIVPNIASGQELAHELGHFLLDGFSSLDVSGHPAGAPRDNLMTKVPNTHSLRIPKQQANFMNPSGFP